MADYGINIGVNVQDSQLKSLTRELKELRQIEQDLAQLNKAGLVGTKKSNDLRRAAKDQASKLKQETKDLAQAFTLNGNAVEKSVGRLKEYTLELKDARSNFKRGSAEARIFTEAITKSNFTATVKGLKNFNLEAKETARALQLLTLGGKDSPKFGAFTGMQDLLAFKPTNTTQSLAEYSRVLEGVIGQVDRASDTYQELASRIREVNNQMAGVPAETMGPATALDSPEAALQRAEFQRQRRARRNRRLKGAAGGALLSGGFPLLFGQSTTAAITGGVGGAIGGAMGGTFGFALGIVGTAIGDAIDKNLKFKKSLGDLNNAFSKAGGDAKFFAGDIDELAKSLRITREEAMQLAASFAFLGDKQLGENAAKLFGTPQLLRSVAQIEDAATLGQALRDLSGEIGEQEAITLGNEIRGLSVREQRLKIEEKLNQVRGRTVKLTNEELRATTRTTRRRAFRGAGPRPTQFKTAIPSSELGVSEGSARFEEFLRSFEDQTGKSKADPTIMLRRRLEVVQSQVLAETDLVELQGKQSQAAKIILRQEMAIGKAKAVAKAELEKFKDPEDQRLIRLRETGEIAVANLKFDREALELAERTLEQTENLVKPLDDQLNAIKDKAAFEREYGELIRAGVIPAVAQQTVEINKQVKEIDRLTEKQLTEIDLRIETLQLLVDAATGTELQAKMQERLNKALERRNEIERRGEEAKGAAGEAAKTPADRIKDEMTAVQGALNNLLDPANQVILAARAIGDAFSESFKGLITGSISAQQALANLFSRTADHFADMAAEMIAHAIRMKILGIALNFFGSAAGASAGSAAPAPKTGSAFQGTLNPPGQFGSGPGFAPPSSFAPPQVGDFSLPPVRASEGGYFAGPTRALVGEGGEPEFVIPESKMRESMARYSRGARGASVIPGSGASGTSGEGGGTAVAAPIDVRFTVERINSVDYVTADQFQRGMRQAAAQGADQGEKRALFTLRQNTAQRKRIGL